MTLPAAKPLLPALDGARLAFPVPPEPETHRAAIPQAEALRRRIVDKLAYDVGKPKDAASERDWFVATALAVRDLVVDCWYASEARARQAGNVSFERHKVAYNPK